MVEKSKLYIEVRKLIESEKKDEEIIGIMKKYGYSKEEVFQAISEYHKDEKTRDDDKLIHNIEKRFRKGEDIHTIITSLVNEGHDSFEVEKAILRANLKG